MRVERERLRAALGRFPVGPSMPEGVDPAVAERLAALGYVGFARDRPAGAGADLPDPREMLPQLERMKEGFRLASAGRSRRGGGRPGRGRACAAGERRGLDPPRPGPRRAEAAASFEQALQRGGLELPDVVEAQAWLQAMVAANPGPRACQAAAVTLKAVGDRTGATRFAACAAPSASR